MTIVPAEALSELAECYARLGVEMQAVERHCAARGACCNFKAAGHRLYITDLEAAMLAASGVEPDMEQAARGVCPFLRGSLCGVREHRALGCRIYFCDTTYEARRNELYETYLKQIRAIETRHGIATAYRSITEIPMHSLSTAAS